VKRGWNDQRTEMLGRTGGRSIDEWVCLGGEVGAVEKIAWKERMAGTTMMDRAAEAELWRRLIHEESRRMTLTLDKSKRSIDWLARLNVEHEPLGSEELTTSQRVRRAQVRMEESQYLRETIRDRRRIERTSVQYQHHVQASRRTGRAARP
jgi:hypothetical protein